VVLAPKTFPFRLCEVLAESQNALELLAGNFVPVLAVGSNGSPQQLARKFPPAKFPNGVLIPVVRAVLEDFDVVYAPLLAAYGACAGERLPQLFPNWSPRFFISMILHHSGGQTQYTRKAEILLDHMCKRRCWPHTELVRVRHFPNWSLANLFS